MNYVLLTASVIVTWIVIAVFFHCAEKLRKAQRPKRSSIVLDTEPDEFDKIIERLKNDPTE